MARRWRGNAMARDVIRAAALAGALTLALAVHAAASAQTPPQLEEVPFITSPDNVTLEMLSAARVRQGDHVIDLGSGDGRIVILAAKRFGATGLGVEIDPQLVERSRRNARDAGVADRTEFREQDLFKTELNRALVEDAAFDAWVKKRTPAGRWGETDELQGAAIFLASDASNFVSGQIIYVDGGLLATM